ncbi:heavy-metal-associated domain-containing protein [Sphingomonadaceae bacterium G21617-S1]|uniref:heavy-metal-associated domain-containing protein n=1 Tax=Rhizorhabdus sp. TaxID=1968843 RepID=UPI0011F4CA49|nr:heavy-metal-associated domain-containing protein [Rhizorhabdus sp.]MBD3761333.1 heavy-metal-associated domain-containing protein [Rhizorhabdus sp.]MCZ4340899.1 heavy-metal-associated domain-containing protein [Sphingomonadaceae bacterium G21617-S1]TAK08324.1 MAG: heavy-metal-associated domain-containing protein [Rhizorhabdus sp.]
MTVIDRLFRPVPISILCVVLFAAGLAFAQLERPDDRGVAPIDGSGSYEVSGVHVDVAARNADQARNGGWREAQRKGWKMLWARVNGKPVENAPGLPDSTLDSISGGIVVEKEQIGPNRYIATLGVLFDRARAGELLGVKGAMRRSAPMLVIPVQWSGATPISFERRTEWQKAWARFRSGNSPIDYVRVSGTGADPVLLNAAQSRRPGRGWWRMLLDQYGAADIVVPEVTLFRQWPGGPVIGKFVARHGPDGAVIDSFTLTAENADAMPAMLDRGVDRIDRSYTRALQEGAFRADKSLVIETPAEEVPIDDVLAEIASAATATITVQADTPDAATLRSTEGALRGMTGVTGVQTGSLALGGVSVFRISFSGPPAAFREALAARGWQVEDAAGGLRIRRGGVTPPAQ